MTSGALDLGSCGSTAIWSASRRGWREEVSRPTSARGATACVGNPKWLTSRALSRCCLGQRETRSSIYCFHHSGVCQKPLFAAPGNAISGHAAGWVRRRLEIVADQCIARLDELASRSQLALRARRCAAFGRPCDRRKQESVTPSASIRPCR